MSLKSMAWHKGQNLVLLVKTTKRGRSRVIIDCDEFICSHLSLGNAWQMMKTHKISEDDQCKHVLGHHLDDNEIRGSLLGLQRPDLQALLPTSHWIDTSNDLQYCGQLLVASGLRTQRTQYSFFFFLKEPYYPFPIYPSPLHSTFF